METYAILGVVSVIIQITNCILFLGGIGVGIFAIVRKNKLGGILTAIGFALFGFNLVQNVIIYMIVIPRNVVSSSDYATFSTASSCIGGGAFILGMLALLAGIIFLVIHKPEPAVLAAEPPFPPA